MADHGGHLGHGPRRRGNLPAVAGRGRDARIADACRGAPRAEREHDYGGGTRPDRRGSPRPGHRRGDPDRLQAGRDRAAAAPRTRRAGGDGGRVAHPGPGRPAPEAGPGPVTRGRDARGGPRPRAGRPRAGRPVRPGRADGPVPRRGRPRRAVPHVVRADRLGRAVHRGVAGPFPVAGGPAEPPLSRPDPVRRVHGHRRPGGPVRARPHARQRPGVAEHDQAESGTAGDHPLARRRPAVPAGGPGRPLRGGRRPGAMPPGSASATPRSARASTCW